MPKIISDAMARRIASDWHGGQATAMLTLATTGEVLLDAIRSEIRADIVTLDVGESRRELLALDKYVTSRGDGIYRGEVDWHMIWSDEMPASEHC